MRRSAMSLHLRTNKMLVGTCAPASCGKLSSDLSVHDRLRRVAHRFEWIAGLGEGDDTAGTTFEALIAPGKRPDQRALVEHELDVAAEILGVQQSLLEGPVVKRKHVGHDPAFGLLVDVFEGAEELARCLAVELGELRGEIRPP